MSATRTKGENKTESNVWKEWRVKALGRLSLQDIYGDVLTGKEQGPGWLEARDPDSRTGDRKPSAGVATGEGKAERGTWKTFRTGELGISVFDYLVERGKAADFREAQRLVAELTGVPLPRPQPSANGKRDSDHNRREIILGTDEYRVVEEAVEALAAGDSDLYQRGGSLVRVTADPRPGRGRLTSTGAPKIGIMPTPALQIRLTRVATFTAKITKSDGTIDEKPAHPPGYLVDGIAAAGHWPGIRPLEAVSEAPVLRPDGSILQQPGYDHDTGILYLPREAFPAVPSHPTRADVERALGALLDVVCDFPFGRPEHQAAWVAALLTPLARFAFDGPSPLFLFDANVRGVGKGMAADPIAIVATGREFARAAYTLDDDEMRKVITSVALEGERLVLFDNVAGSLGNASLDAALTTTEWQGRILGKSQQPRLPLLATWYATGNNVVLLADTARRTCHVRLESPEEKPEEREGFRHPNLLSWVRENRGELLAAALTVLSAYCRAGKPDQRLKPWGSFEGWSALVRAAVVWAGLPDPGATRMGLDEQADREAMALRGLLAGWQELDPNSEGLTVGEALNTLGDKVHQARYATLREVLGELFDLPVGKLPTTRQLSKKLSRFAGRNVGGLCFASRTAHGGVLAWHVRNVAQRAR